MNKHVESLPKEDKSITFHYCTVICDVLRPIGPRRHFFKKTTQIVSDFMHFNFFLKWANLRLSLNIQKPKVFQLQGGLCPLNP